MHRPLLSSSRLSLIAATIGWALSPFASHADNVLLPTPVMKATSVNMTHWQTDNHADIAHYYASEKLDGIRAIWTGNALITRQGKPLYAPAWFTASLPPDHAIEGELWIERGQFQHLSQIVLDKQPNEKQWRKVKFMLFDAPASTGSFTQRLATLQQLAQRMDPTIVQVINQRTLTHNEALHKWLATIERNGGEGIMLHHKENPYYHGRSAGVLKIKSYQDDEAIVTGYEPGKGKYAGVMGAVWVVTSDNIRFKIGSGFRDHDREHPPVIGSMIQYRFNGYTQRGIPRFARYIRPRANPDQ
ncbi:DNA ligase [Photobacterium japonica]|uniref:DNA ligase n=1 Tax=Photobacterium japonica TaxID=2910235 RepID=UPI003D1252E7